MRKRIFITINLPEQAKNILVDYQEKWQDLPVRWVKQNSLHLTLAFLGEIDDQSLASICRGLKEVVSGFPFFSIRLNRIDYDVFGEKIPRLIWAKGQKSENLCLLKKKLDEFLNKQVGFFPERNDFIPHITLGRVRQWQWSKMEIEERPEIKEDINLDFEAKSVEVMESRLKRTGPEYTVLQSELFKNYE